MGKRSPTSDEMIIEIVKLRRQGKGLHDIAKPFDVSHMTVKRLLESDRAFALTGFKKLSPGDHARFTRDVQSGAYHLKAGDTVIFEESARKANTAWVSGGRLPREALVDVPMNALESVA